MKRKESKKIIQKFFSNEYKKADALSDNGFRLGKYNFYEGYTKMQNHLKSLPLVTQQLAKRNRIIKKR